MSSSLRWNDLLPGDVVISIIKRRFSVQDLIIWMIIRVDTTNDRLLIMGVDGRLKVRMMSTHNSKMSIDQERWTVICTPEIE